MKKLTSIFLPVLALLLFAGCAEESKNNGGNVIPPVVSEGLADNAVLHDTPKIGTVSFKPASHIIGNSYLWNIEGVTLSNAAGREITAEFNASGSYIVTLNVGGVEYKGRIIIPDAQSYEIDMGDNHTIISDIGQKRLFIYGDNTYGQLCIEKSILNLKEPRILKSYTSEISSVAAGKNHTLFTDNSNVYACGDNSYSQLGTGSTNNIDNVTTVSIIAPLETGSYKRIFVSAGGDMSVAGYEFLEGKAPKISLYNWGYNDSAANKIQSEANLLTTANSRQDALFATGDGFSIVRATSSYNVFSFGVNDKWQLGRIAGAGTGYPKLGEENKNNPEENPELNITDMAPGYVYTPYGEEGSSVNYYQNNYFAKLAAGDDFVVSIKKETKADATWTMVEKYSLYVWGNNDKNQLGFNSNGKAVSRATPLFDGLQNQPMETDPNKVTPIHKEMIEVAAGKAAGYAVSSDGILYGWGDNSKNQLTSNKTANTVNNIVYEISNPENVSSGYKKVWAGGDRVIALAGDNNLYTWGDNKNGILGTGNTSETVATPEKLYFSLLPVQ
ncbi:MAG TPA: hypothetical protein H9804_02430 [Candidatus Mucispirillum faecigallinarum]|uniref:PKD domain-containing protein n=1 Tax=Candidatus Mucispirillum faecigallinarum TaxID=2838699 RepID=A0A9D2KB66_9BACT|nr:hypothetical protein [Candidatus Mucispirillum faecigallinarum]